MYRPAYSKKSVLYAIIQLCLTGILLLIATNSLAAEKKPLKIEQFSLNRSVAYLGEEIIADISINAISSYRTKKLRIRYYLNQTQIGEQHIDTFDGSGYAKTRFQFKHATEGRYQFRVVLDVSSVSGVSTSTVEVSRQVAILSLPAKIKQHLDPVETGNKKGEKLPTGPGSNKPDLDIESIAFDIASPQVGQSITIKSVIANTGKATANQVKIRIFIDGQPHGKDILLNIEGGSSANISSSFKANRQGKKDVLIFVNPDGEIDEKSNRNNLLSKILIVRPAPTTKKKETKVAAIKAKTKVSKQANLVIYIETIAGTHYTDDGKVRFYITNNSQSISSKKFTMGVQRQQKIEDKSWLRKQSVHSLKPGETTTVEIDWPKNRLSTSEQFIATVDIDAKSNKLKTIGNQTRLFKVVSTSQTTATATTTTTTRKPVLKRVIKNQQAEIIITSPKSGKIFPGKGQFIVNWKTRGKIGNKVRISILTGDTRHAILSSTSSNDGTFSTKQSLLPDGEYLLQIHNETGSASSLLRSFVVKRNKPKSITKLNSPSDGSRYRGEQQLKASWSEDIKKTAGLRINLVLREESSSKELQLNNDPVSASKGDFLWQVPDDGTVFGIYTLEARSASGKLLARAKDIELLPNFVSFEHFRGKEGKETIKTDLEIARTSFKGQNLEFLIMNNGPSDISVSGLFGYKFTSYFVIKTPITSNEDLVVCTSSLLAELPQGEGQLISLGRDPDCALGERDFGSKFEYVVNRFTLPTLESQYLVDQKPANNISKFYWPD